MKIIHFDSLDSTNDYLKQNYKNLENYTFVSADFQTNGKGRNKRKWISENKENLLFSLLLLDKQLFEHYKELSIITAYSIVKVLEELGIKDLSIKWPNDVYVKDSKICGILLESISLNNMECLVIGVGLNVNQEIFDDDYRVNPTSVIKEIKVKQDIDIIKNKIYDLLLTNITRVKDGNNFYFSVKQYDYLKGKKISYIKEDRRDDVLVVGIQEDYSLLINDDNNLINIYSGEVDNIIIK